MLIRYAAENYRSLKSRQELTLVASSLAGPSDPIVMVPGVKNGVLRLAAIYGANASGKTNVIRALHYMRTVVRDSYREWEPGKGTIRNNFKFGGGERPSRFEVSFIKSGVRYEYGFALDDECIVEEWLYAFPRNKQQKWFERRVNTPIEFGPNFVGENRAIENLTRPNSLFLSTGAQNNHLQLLPVYEWFSEQLRFLKGERDAQVQRTARMWAQEEVRENLRELLRVADLGIVDVLVNEEEWPKDIKELFGTVSKTLHAPAAALPEKYAAVRLVHVADETPVPLPLSEESAGTRAYFGMLGGIVSALRRGDVFFVDELDSSLHPLLSMKILDLFSSPLTNPKGAQLIFNTHDTNLLCFSKVRRDQIWFTEKDREGSTQLYPLSDFKPRESENLQRGYLQGRYGAIPFFGRTDFLSSDEPAAVANG